MPDLAELIFAPLSQAPVDEPRDHEFLVVPAKGTPRWFLPSGYPTIDPAAAGWSPYRTTSRWKWAVIRVAHRAGCLAGLPGSGRVNIAAGEIDWRAVGCKGKSSPVPLVYVGTPSPSRKAVIHLVNPDSRVCEAIVKVPLTEAAKAAILCEADVLEILADENYLCAPRLLYVDRTQGVTTQTFLAGKVGGRKFTDAHKAALRSLMLTGEYTTLAGHAIEWQQQLEHILDSQADCRIITAAMCQLEDAGPLPACWVHGDFAPWNTRYCGDGTVALVDWEDAQRSGLPLQDAFHFFHMQDYLFGARPTAHADDVQSLATAIGVSPQQCHKLEIAYLAYSYLRRREIGESQHCDYLLAMLRVVLEEKPRLLPSTATFKVVASANIAPASPPTSSHIRADLLAAVIARLNFIGIPYCVLSGHENYAENNSSDVDFMFHPRDEKRIGPLLAQAALQSGARLIQAMHHETYACSFVMAKEDGRDIGYLDPDCGTDYRARGRLWLSARNALARRRRREDFYVPAVPDEFAYYLVKKVLKQSIVDFQLRRLRHLYQRDPANCRAEIAKFWPAATARMLERALAASDLAWFQSSLPNLSEELMASAAMENAWQRSVQRLRDGLRIMERALHPTGMCVLLCGGSKEQQSAIAQGLLQRLAPAFRRVARMEYPVVSAFSLIATLRLAGKVFVSRLRSTLVVGAVESGKQNWRAFAARLLVQPNVVLVLRSDESQSSPIGETEFNSAAQGQRVVYLNSGLSTEQSVQQASRTILTWLAARLEKRLSLQVDDFMEPVAGALVSGRARPANAVEGVK